MKTTKLFLFFFFTISFIQAQTILTGKITDEENGEELIGANLRILKEGIFRTGVATDFDGNYSVNIDPGEYEVQVSYVGYTKSTVTGVIVAPNKTNKLDVQLKSGDSMICFMGCHMSWIVPLLSQDETSTGEIIFKDRIENAPVKNIDRLIGMGGGVSIREN